MKRKGACVCAFFATERTELRGGHRAIVSAATLIQPEEPRIERVHFGAAGRAERPEEQNAGKRLLATEDQTAQARAQVRYGKERALSHEYEGAARISSRACSAQLRMGHCAGLGPHVQLAAAAKDKAEKTAKAEVRRAKVYLDILWLE